MAIDASFPIVEEGNGSPHGEVFRCVYNFTESLEGVPIVCPMSGVLYWAFVAPVADQYPFGIALPPAAPRAATNAAELYVTPVAAVGTGGFPAGAHQDNQGVVEYAAVGVARLGFLGHVTKGGLPAGVVVVDNLTAITHGYPGAFETYVDRLYMVKTRGIVQVRVDAAQANIAVGDYLEGVAGSYDLIQDAANINEGTFIALEVSTADDDTIWCDIVNVNY